jgi:ribosomal protein S18 acetylase RimI-like enzyme
MQISDLPAERCEDAVALWRATGLIRPWNDPYADLTRAMVGPTSTVLGAQDREGRLLGTAMVGHDGHRGWVYYLAVRPDVQRGGLGRQLMQASERWLHERGVPKVNLMVRTSNDAVVAFYTSLGYEDGDVVVLGKFLDGW